MNQIMFRNPGAPSQDWTETVEWPADLRVPVAGEMVDLPMHGQVYVEAVQWFCGDESRRRNSNRPVIQVIVR